MSDSKKRSRSRSPSPLPERRRKTVAELRQTIIAEQRLEKMLAFEKNLSMARDNFRRKLPVIIWEKIEDQIRYNAASVFTTIIIGPNWLDHYGCHWTTILYGLVSETETSERLDAPLGTKRSRVLSDVMRDMREQGITRIVDISDDPKYVSTAQGRLVLRVYFSDYAQ